MTNKRTSTPHSGTRTFAVGAFLALLCTAGGCGPKVIDAPDYWPQRIGDLKLYNTSLAYIYAADDTVAGETDRLVQRTAREFKRHAKSPPQKGLVIACNKVAELPVSDAKSHYFMSQQALDEAPSDEELERRWEAIQATIAETGMDVETELPLRTLVMAGADLPGIVDLQQQAAAEVAWAIELPSRYLIEETARQVMNKKLKQRGTGPVEAVAFAPILIVEESRIVNNAAVHRDITLFAEWSRHHEAWEPHERQELVQEFTQRRLNEAMFPVLTSLRDALVGVGTAVAEPFTPDSEG